MSVFVGDKGNNSLMAIPASILATPAWCNNFRLFTKSFRSGACSEKRFIRFLLPFSVERPFTGPRMWQVFSDQREILFRYRRCFFRTGNMVFSRDGKFIPFGVFPSEEPGGEGTGQNLSHQGWNRVSNLSLDFGPRTGNFKSFWKRFNGRHLLPGEFSVFPMERADGGSGLGLNSPTWLGFGEFQKKAPIPCSPTEQRQSFFPIGMPQIVFSFGNGWYQVRPFAAYFQILFLVDGYFSDRFPRRDIRSSMIGIKKTQLGIVFGFGTMRRFRKGKFRSVYFRD